jgi:hypothetical protein
MDDKERNRFADALLEAALRGYGSEAPRPGLEARILARVQAREREAQSHWWAWALAATAAALAIGVFSIYYPRHQPVIPPPTPSASKPEPESPVTVAVVPQPSAALQVRARRTRPVTNHPSRPAQFPTPAPLTEQEKLLLLYVKQTPASVLAAPVNRPLDEDVEIPELNIAALEIRPLGESEETQEK